MVKLYIFEGVNAKQSMRSPESARNRLPPSLPRILFFFLGLLSTENVSSGQNERRQWFREGDQLSKPVNASINHSGGERDRAGEKERGREGKAGKEATLGRRLNIRARMTQITFHVSIWNLVILTGEGITSFNS